MIAPTTWVSTITSTHKLRAASIHRVVRNLDRVHQGPDPHDEGPHEEQAERDDDQLRAERHAPPPVDARFTVYPTGRASPLSPVPRGREGRNTGCCSRCAPCRDRGRALVHDGPRSPAGRGGHP